MYRLFAACVFMIVQTISVACYGSMETTSSATTTETLSSDAAPLLNISLRIPPSGEMKEVPLFSDKYAQTPVATVNGEPITLGEFAGEIAELHRTKAKSDPQAKESYIDLLNRLIGIKLVVQESLNIGLDQTPDVQTQMTNFSLTTLIRLLIQKQIEKVVPDEAKIDELYKQMALEAKMTTYKFQTQADAHALLDLYNGGAGGDFNVMAMKMVESGKASGGEDSDYIKLKDLVPNVADAAFTMEVGAVSQIFKAEKGYLLFKLEDRRVYEDPEARAEAAKMVFQREATSRQSEYFKELEKEYVTFDPAAQEALDFDKLIAEHPDANASDVFAKLRNDQRPLASINNNGKTIVITVAEIAKELEGTLYHGTERKIDPQKINPKKETVLQDKLIRILGEIEAKKQGIDKSDAYIREVNRFREKVLFETFMSKAVLPDVKIFEDEVRDYYTKNISDYTSPLMLKMKNLVFSDEKNAQDALKKLQAGSDFKWVSANVTGLVADDDKDRLNLAGSLLSITALPEKLQKIVKDARQGDMFLYEDPGKLSYVLIIENAYPPEAKSYEEVKNEVARIVYSSKISQTLDDFLAKLKEAYETEIFIVQEK